MTSWRTTAAQRRERSASVSRNERMPAKGISLRIPLQVPWPVGASGVQSAGITAGSPRRGCSQSAGGHKCVMEKSAGKRRCATRSRWRAGAWPGACCKSASGVVQREIMVWIANVLQLKDSHIYLIILMDQKLPESALLKLSKFNQYLLLN